MKSAAAVDVPAKGAEIGSGGITNRPPDTAFKQQLLSPLWQPILTPKFVVRTFFLWGLLFCCIGASLLASSGTVEVEVQYDGEGTPSENKACQISESNAGNLYPGRDRCTVVLEATEDMPSPVYLYYKATSVYQDHRLYVESRELKQLQGEDADDASLEDRCAPEVTADECVVDDDTTCPPKEQPSLKTKDDKYMWPCGSVANSFFNDVITPNTRSATGVWKTTGIAWPGDIEVKFKNPASIDTAKYRYLWDTFPVSINAPCPDPDNGPWHCTAGPGSSSTDQQCVYDATCPAGQTCDRGLRCDEDEYDPDLPNTGLVDEHFVNWMRTSARPDFRKLHGIIEADVKAGDRVIFDIVPNFRVDSYGGKKFLVLSTGSWMGGNGNLIGVLYLVFGMVFLLYATIFLLKHRASPRKLSDTRYTFKTAAAAQPDFRRGE